MKINLGIFLLIMVALQSCNTNQQADVVFYNGTIYTVDSGFTTCTAMAIKDGKIIHTGSDQDMQLFSAKEKIDLKGQFVYPGLIDAHCHFYGYGVDLKKINLTGTTSWQAVLDSLVHYKNKTFSGWIFGRGWDQNDWEVKQYPSRKELDSLFPDVPVFLLRIDGHAAIANKKALELGGFNTTTRIEGGEIETHNGELTGLLIDNAVDTLKKKIPLPPRSHEIEALLAAQANCFATGLTTISDAGLDYSTIELIDSLHQLKQLKMRYYAMVSFSRENFEYFKTKGKIKTEYLNVRSFKVYADGALGSRGALLKQPYLDRVNWNGFFLTPLDTIKEIANKLAANGFQMCTHCIGDSSISALLDIYGAATKNLNDARWRIEHCQVVDENDLEKFARYNVVPSVQPTHATSDMYWAEDRIGSQRIKGAYAYKQLLAQNGVIACGSDFPVESINPLYGFYAAVSRKDHKNYPPGGFEKENALTREQALRGMTIWAAYSNFEEHEKGSLEKGKFADFIILADDLMTAPEEKLWQLEVQQTWVGGERVFSR